MLGRSGSEAGAVADLVKHAAARTVAVLLDLLSMTSSAASSMSAERWEYNLVKDCGTEAIAQSGFRSRPRERASQSTPRARVSWSARTAW